MSNFDMDWQEKSFWFSNLLLISKMLGWNLYLQITLSTGSEKLTKLWLIIYMFPFIFKFETAFLEKVFNSSAIFWSSCNNSLSLTSCILEPRSPLFEKKGLTVFQRSLLLSQMMDLDYWAFFLFLFYTAVYRSFLLFEGS